MELKIHYDEKSGFITVGHLCFAPSFRSVTVKGKHAFDFSRSQGWVLSLIFEYHEKGFAGIHQAEVIRHLNDLRDESDMSLLDKVRLRDCFKVASGKVHPAWGTLVKTTKGRDSKIYIDFDWLP